MPRRRDSSAASPLLPERLRARRAAQRLSCKQVYTRAGVSRAYYWSLENRVGTNPSADILERVARVLDTSTTYLLGQTEVSGRGGPLTGIPPGLATAAARLRLTPEETRFLVGIAWRGRRPRTEGDWVFLSEAIDRACT